MTPPPNRHKKQDKPRGKGPAPDVRRVANQMLNAVLDEGRLLSDLTGRKGPLGRLDAPDRARAQRLVTETLRNLDPLDALLDQFVARTPPLPVLNVLRIAAYELCVGEAAHGVVNAAVTALSS